MAAFPTPYRHVVLFRWKPEVGETQLRRIEEAFAALARALPFVTGFEWGRNESPEGLDHGYTHCFVVTFADAAGRDAYLPHPLHEAFVRDLVEPYMDDACVVDFPAVVVR